MLLRRLSEFFAGHLFPSIAITPELAGQRLAEGGVGILNLPMQNHRRAAFTVAILGEVIVQHHGSAVDYERRVHDALAVGREMARQFLGAKSLLVEVDGGSGIGETQMRGEGFEVAVCARCQTTFPVR